MRKKEIERETIPCPDFVCFHITIIFNRNNTLMKLPIIKFSVNAQGLN